jgi:nucleoside-diphosphate-sugar epimerase
MAKLIIGCGYLGSRVARRWRDAGHEVFAVTRSGERARAFTREGYRAIVADVLDPASLTQLPVSDSVLFAIARGRDASISIHELYVDGLRNVLDALPQATGRILYASSTGVYAHSRGETVDESSPTEPVRDGGRASLAAEQLLRAHRLGDRAIILRLAGLYGPGRIPLVDKIRAGEPIPAPDEGWLNLIHVDDAASAVVAAAERAAPPRTYLVADGQPVLRRDYYRELARLLAAPEPRFAPPAADNPAAARATSSKRVSSARMQAELRVPLAYPSFREGLAAILRDESASPREP